MEGIDKIRWCALKIQHRFVFFFFLEVFSAAVELQSVRHSFIKKTRGRMIKETGAVSCLVTPCTDSVSSYGKRALSSVSQFSFFIFQFSFFILMFLGLSPFSFSF